ncbi:MAG: hypothetical protein V3T05_00290, partial [Myxococcota bacterium]
MDVQAQSEPLREDGMTFAEMFEESQKKTDPVKEGEIVRGRVIEVGKDMVLIDIGYKSEASVSIGEFTIIDGERSVKVDDEID